MSNIPIYGWGGSHSSTGEPVYGYGLSTLPDIQPQTGTIRGGDPFIISGSGISDLGYYDSFVGSLNPFWTNTSSGGSLITSSTGLTLSVPIGGGQASITHTITTANFDVAIEYFNDATLPKVFPTSGFNFCELRAEIDSTSYATIAHTWDPTKGSLIVGTIVNGGITEETQYIIGSSSSKILRMVRFAGRIQFWAGHALLMDYYGWRTESVTIKVSASSAGTPFPIKTKLLSFIPAVVVAFGSEIAPQINQRNPTLISGFTPPTILPGMVPVSISAFGHDSIMTNQLFTYVAPLQLTISETSVSGTVVITNDDTLRDTGADSTGLRL